MAKRLYGIMKVPHTKNIYNLFQGPPNPGFRSVKVQTETFLKKDSRNFKKYFYLGFLWIPSKPRKQNWKVPFFWVFIIVKNQCATPSILQNIYMYLQILVALKIFCLVCKYDVCQILRMFLHLFLGVTYEITFCWNFAQVQYCVTVSIEHQFWLFVTTVYLLHSKNL